MPDVYKIRYWMYHSAKSYTDPSGEINCTRLAEGACEQFSGYDDNTIPDLFFELAIDAMNKVVTYGYPGEKNKD